MQLTLMERECPFKELKYIIELDRRGSNDCVFYDCDNNDFTRYVESFGFVEAIGSFSDISEICPSWGIAGVNLSVGYSDEHSYVETLRVGPLFDTIQKVKNMLNDAENIEKFEYVFSPTSYYSRFYNNVYGSSYNVYGFPIEEDDYDIEYTSVQCNTCGKQFSEYEVIPVQCENGMLKFYCPDCLTMDKVDWCPECGEAYEKLTPEAPPMLCYACKKENLLKKGNNHSWTSRNNFNKSSNTPKISTASTSKNYLKNGNTIKNGFSTTQMGNLSTNTQKK